MTKKILLNNGSVLKKDGEVLPIIDDGLMAYYPLGENAGGTAFDETKNGYDGTIRGGVTQGVDGIVGQAYDFDGLDSYVEISSPPDPSGAGDSDSFAVTFWLKPRSDGSENPLIEWSTGNNYRLHIWQFQSEGSFFCNPVGGCGTFGRYNGEIKLDQWSHYGVVYDKAATQLRFYRDGSRVYAANADCNPDTSSDTLFLGHRANDSRYFNGKMDSVRIYNRALSPATIQTIYEKTKP